MSRQSERGLRVLRSLAELGNPSRPARPQEPNILELMHERPPCPCGKVSYPDRDVAVRTAYAMGSSMSAYRCPLGHAVYHLKGTGRSRRQRGGA